MPTLLSIVHRGVLSGFLAAVLGVSTASAGQLPPSQAGATSSPTNANDTLLLEAAMLGQVADVRRAMAAGANLHAQGDSGSTPLALAAAHGHLEIVTILLAAGADVSLTDRAGGTALKAAASQGKTKIVAALARPCAS